MSTPVQIGLRSGKVIIIQVFKDRPCEVDASAIKADDLALAMAATPLFSGQLFRPTCEAEHSVTLSYMTEDPVQQLQGLVLSAAEVLVGSQVGPACRGLLREAIFKALNVSPDNVAALYELDGRLTAEEVLLLHPARNFLLPRADPTLLVDSGLTTAQKAIVRSRVNRDAFRTLRDAVDEYLNRWSNIVLNDRITRETEAAVQQTLVSAGFWPHRVKTTVADISNIHRVPFAKVAAAVEALVAAGTLAESGGFYYVITPAADPGTNVG